MIPAINTNNQFFNQLPDDCTPTICKFLDDQSVITTASVCRGWKNNPTLENKRQEYYTRLYLKYPIEMRELFQNCNSPIWQLPVLELGGRRGSTDYIDFLQPEEMNQSVMRFRDRYRRSGIALKIQATPAYIRRRALSRIVDNIRHYEIRQIGQFFRNWGQSEENVLALFQRYTNSTAQWAYGWGNSDNTIERMYNDRHNQHGHVSSVYMECSTCPFINRRPSDTVLRDLLTNQDPDFKLPGHNGGVPPQQARSNRSFSGRAIVITAMAAIILAYLVMDYSSADQHL